ncbi:MAG: MBL fold metallo-hydrolase [Candidatus Aminicenantes bacterium]|nr:MBL fold metallo-hydrolase [Candidatus Aminicenantes bacterium]
MKSLESRGWIIGICLWLIIGFLGIKASNNLFKGASAMMTEEIKSLLAYVLEKNEVAFQYLGYSGVIIRTAQEAIIIDPADKIKEEDIRAIPLGAISLILFTHDHYDHFHPSRTLSLFKASGATILAEANVINRLKGEIPTDKLVVASPDKPFQLGNITVKAIKGSHVGPIMLYHLTIGDLTIFHGGDSDYVPLSGLSADLAFLPAGEPSPTASPQAAFNMARDLKVKVVVALHGSSRQYQELEKLIQEKMKGTKIIIPLAYSINRIKLD